MCGAGEYSLARRGQVHSSAATDQNAQGTERFIRGAVSVSGHQLSFKESLSAG